MSKVPWTGRVITSTKDYGSGDGNHVIVLLGPIGTFGGWHAVAAKIIREIDEGEYDIIRPYEASPSEQGGFVEWLEHYMFRATQYGTPLFWFPKNRGETVWEGTEEHACYYLAQFIERYRNDSRVTFAVGIEEGYSGAEFLRHQLRNIAIPVHDTLEATCRRAVELA